MDPLDTNATKTPLAPNGERDKYIRTFASDMEIYQRGGTPGLAPLKTPSPLTAEVPTTPRAVPDVSIDVEQKPTPVVAPPAPPTEAREQFPLTPEPGFMLPSIMSRERRDSNSSPAPLKTYLEDFRAHMKDTHASTMSILAAEQDAGPKRSEPLPELPQDTSKNRWYIGGGVALLIVSSVGVYLAYGHYLSSLLPVLVAPGPATPIFVDNRDTVSGTGIVLMQEIKKSIDTPLALGTVRLLTHDSATSSVFMLLKVSAPGNLTRNISALGSMAGIVHTDAGQGPFFILEVGSFSSTFSGMLAWEPMMQTALATIFPLYPAAVIPTATTSVATTTATTTPARTQATTTVASTTARVATSSLPVPSMKEGFRDEMVSNHDVRVYRDGQGRSILLYGYADQSTLIIARDPLAFAELLSRLATSHAL